MLRKILTTIGTRYLVAILNLALIFINAKELGIEGVGLVGVLVASVNIAVIFNGILCGNTLIYFMNRYSLRRIIVPAYVWTLAGSGLACGFMLVTTLLPTAYWKEIYGLAILTTLANANARFLLGKERIKAFNLTQALQGGLLFFVLVYLYFVARRPTVGSYIAGLYVANGIACLYSFYRGDLHHPPQLFPDPAIRGTGRRGTARRGHPHLGECLAHQPKRQLHRI